MGHLRGPEGLSLTDLVDGGGTAQVPPPSSSPAGSGTPDRPVALPADFLRLDAWEQALSLPVDAVPPRPARRLPQPVATTRATMEALLRPALAHGPCHVLFSGGRDSSALLAVATHVARRDGLPDPVPVTAVHLGADQADETAWQERVLRHLGLADRVLLRLHGEQRLLGRLARAALRRHGLVWPEAVQLHGAYYERLPPGSSVVSGEGGDQLVGPRRATALREAVLRRDTRAVARHLAPRSLVRARLARRLDTTALFPWLTDRGRAVLVRSLGMSASVPLRWDAETRTTLSGRPHALFATNYRAAALEYRLQPVDPFFDPSVVGALAVEGGPRGLGDRTAMMRHLFGDLLPDDVLSRTTKASFDQTRWGAAERAFARGWSGEGVDRALVDVDRLRSAWLSDAPPPGSDFQLHAAWLAAGSPDPAAADDEEVG